MLQATSHYNNTNTNSCPLCGTNVTQLSFEDHYQQELSQLMVPSATATFGIAPSSPPSPSASSIVNTRKRSAVGASTTSLGRGSKLMSKSGGAETLVKIRKNRTNRASTNHSSNHVTTALLQEQPHCFLCGEVLFGDIEEVNHHIDVCLAAQDSSNHLV
eukprot:TRINITY_DN11750_c0_g1_i1.p1 TRINITY_DN11750_c0_g1~~TRINITY_DN11750_c0_g1_i1.p1  ORF type:complete len:159 (-),score=13.84 TRINITY_DN11750_c0_g1_i1:344-820(-)